MKLYLIAFLLLGLLTGSGCAEKKNAAIPKEIIQPAAMQSLLTDLHMADAAIEMKSLTGDTINKLYTIYYKQIFEQHKLTKEHFEKSMDYYSINANKLDEMYGQIINELNKKNN